jgi:GntR family transcriptional repressor for pyruvate dehydrogenase complex
MPVVPASGDEIYAALRKKITEGAPGYRAGDRIPTQFALAAEYGVSRDTIIRVVARLKADHLLVTRGGNGTLVAERNIE